MRTLKQIAKEIESNWTNVHFGAKPYLHAMHILDTVDDYFGNDRADMIVAYFLANSVTWRGEVARRIKRELNEMIK